MARSSASPCGFGQSLLVGLAVGAHPRLGLGRRLVQRRSVGPAVVAELLVQGVFVRRLVADAPPVDLLLPLALAHLALQAVALLLHFGQRLKVDIHALLVRAPAHDDLRRDEDDHQRQIGDQRDAQADTMVVGPRPHILPAVVEGQFDTRPAGGFRFVVTGCFSHCGVSEF